MAGGWMVGFLQEIIPLRGSILQARTCQIVSLAEIQRWSLVWQYRIGALAADIFARKF